MEAFDMCTFVYLPVRLAIIQNADKARVLDEVVFKPLGFLGGWC